MQVVKCTLLGVGSSLGVPVVGCHCSVCTSDCSKNQRSRSAALFEINGKKLLIDAGPDIRSQLLKGKVSEIDAVFITHSHYDHVAGLNDLRVFARKRRLTTYLSLSSYLEIKSHAQYLFDSFLEPCILEGGREISFGGSFFLTLSYQQKNKEGNVTDVLGLRVGTVAYLTDIKIYDPSLVNRLVGIKTLILGAIRRTPSFAHFAFCEAIAFSQKLHSEKTILIHLDHTVDYEKERKELPAGVELGYDGMIIVGA